jgi:hypothetical protein
MHYDLDAGLRARCLRPDQLLENGDEDGFHVWARILRAIKKLLEAEPSRAMQYAALKIQSCG